MAGIEVCEECGVPLMISSGFTWEGNGVIRVAMSPTGRVVFYESGNIDNLFKGIKDLVGVPIEHVVIESRRRETRKYIEKLYMTSLKEDVDLARNGMKEKDLPRDSAVRQKLLEVAREINVNINNIGRINGSGDITLGRGWDEDEEFPWRTQIIRDPYSLMLYAGDMLGSVEAIENIDHCVEYREIEDGVYEISAFPGEHPIELKGRLRRRKYDYKPGDLEYERCPVCGLPHEVMRCDWDLSKGTITDPETGRRMAMFGPTGLEAVLDDLEAELGEAVPEMVVKAQKDYVKGYVGEENWKQDALSFRRLIASRGLGNLTGFEGDRTSLNLTIENSCLHLLMVGTAQAMVEMVYGVDDSTCEWDIAEDGDLSIVIHIG
jgi:hypothetical protein